MCTVHNVYNFNINIKEIKYKKMIDIIKENKYTFYDRYTVLRNDTIIIIIIIS